MTTTAKYILTPAQFKAARTLASTYNHLWSSVDDETYNVDDIVAYSESIQNPNLPGGIYAPSLVNDPDWDHQTVYHRTGSGRLSWEVNTSGNVCLQIWRPSDARAQSTDSVESGICVAKAWLINDDTDQYNFVDDIEIITSNYSLHQKYALTYDENVYDEFLFQRHVYALVRPIVALLTVNHPYQQIDNDYTANDEAYKAYRETVIQPAIEKAKAMLAPLFEIALPDPVVDAEDREFQKPEQTTYWVRKIGLGDDVEGLRVVHNNEMFPVETEKTAVHTVLLLQKNPDMHLIDAIKAAIYADSYRPE